MISLWFTNLATQTALDPIQQLLLNNGVMGVFIILLLFTDRLHTNAIVKELRDQVAKKDEIIRILSAATQHTIPAMQRNAEVLEAIPDREAALLGEIAFLVEKLEKNVAKREGR